MGIIIAALLVVALVAWPNLSGAPQTGPTPASSQSAVSSQIGPTPASPSEAPTPSPAASGLFVEPNVIDRPGVPEALYDKYWIAFGQVGQVGTTARLMKPPNERLLGADAGRVASFALDANFEPIIGPNGVTIIVRDILTGATQRTVDTSIVPSAGLIAGSFLFWIGVAFPIDTTQPVDGGVWVVDLADPTAEPQAIIPPSNLGTTYGAQAVRGLLRLTDGGHAVTTLIESETTIATDVIDVSSLTLRTTLDGLFAFDIADGLAVVAPLHSGLGNTGGPARIRLFDIATGHEVGSGVETDLVKWSVAGEGKVFVQFGRNGSDSYISAIALDSGEVRDIRVRLGGTETLDLSPQLSTPDLLVLLPIDDPTFDAQGRVQIPVTLLDPATGDLQVDAFTIGDP